MIWLEVLTVFALVMGASLAISAFIVWLESKPDCGESFLSRFFKINFSVAMSGWSYFGALLALTIGAGVWIFIVGLAQGYLPMNPGHFGGLSVLKAAHLAVAAATHTNWQPFAPEANVSAFTQTFAVGVTNVLIGAISISAWFAFVNVLARKPLGNAWRGVWRGLVILVPLQILLTIILVSQGVSENFLGHTVETGPVAGFIAGNLVSGAGAGWMGDSFASAIQNPTLISDLASLALLLGVPLGFLYATGKLIAREKLIERLTLAVVAVIALFTAVTFLYSPPVAKDFRWPVSEALWLNATAGSGNGTVNAPVERFQPFGRLPPFLTLLAGMPFPPPVGCGVALLLMYLLIAIYLGSLMVGRSPDFLGFRVRTGEVVSTAVGVLGPQLVILIACAALVITPEAIALFKSQGPYAASSLMWMIGSCGQNNGSAYQLDLSADVFVKASLIIMALGRLFTLGSIVMLATYLSKQREEPPIPPSVNPQGFMMISFWLSVIIIGAALAMLPLLIIGPLLEALK